MEKKILVVRFSAMGDLILTTGPLWHLRRKFTGATIHLLTSEIGNELYVNSIDVDKTIVVRKGARPWELAKIYRKMDSYDVIIDLQGNFKSWFLKIFHWAKFYKVKKQSRERRAFVKNRSHKEELNKHVVEKYYDTMRAALPELPELSREDLRPLFPNLPVHFNGDEFEISQAVAIHPYASQKNKQWPYFKELCEKLIQQGRNIVIFGSSESPIELPDSKQVLNLTNKTSLREMTAILSQTQSFITTDSGPMHMGVALKKPTLALFGPTTKEFGFYPDFENVKVVEEDLECRPCHVHGGDTCPLEHHNCMQAMSVDKVLLAWKSL